MVSASHCVGLILPGMMEEPGSFSGMRNSPMPARGPEAYQRTSLASFISAPASVRSAAEALTIASCPASAANLFGAETNCLPVAHASSAATASPKRGCAFSPVPTAVPPIASSSRSEEHTSELQSRGHLVCRLLLEKKKKKNINIYPFKNKKKIFKIRSDTKKI